MDSYEKLANGIIELAVKDYRRAAKFLVKHPRTKELEDTVEKQLAERRHRIEKRRKLNLPNGLERRSKEERLLDRIYSNECMLADIERFFRSRWFGSLTDINGQWLLERLRREQEAG
ncbi:hypothetical protein [Selenomonas sp. AB3002]|uniref:hypothetical protein n=1 Tax=Selenomonas sp. AB3002 TaxID=1392502 RepID=UPI000497A841